MQDDNLQKELTEQQKISIQQINRDTVHRICSGQVVTTLTSAVKELVENAIDASATSVDIFFKEYGSLLIQVADNGAGIHEDDFQTLTLKHYTSKITKFSDLESVETLGFRGEALSSLCALSEVTVITKHSSSEFATRINYDHNGKITNKQVCAREQGTTVILEKLFASLPVRRKQFLKNLKKEFHNMCQLLQAYCLVSKGIKFTCTNLTDRGTKNKVLSTDGFSSVKSNIIDIFGVKQISTLVDVDLVEPNEEILAEYGLNLQDDCTQDLSFEFIISALTEDSGRTSKDRQFYFINSRPWDATKVNKLINGLYKQFKPNHYPFVFLNVFCKSSTIDVNITPDKRQIFLQEEKHLLATIKASLSKLFSTFPSTFKLQNLDLSQKIDETQNKGVKRSLSDSFTFKKGNLLDKYKNKRHKSENDKQPTLKEFSFIKKSLKDSDCVRIEEVHEIDEEIESTIFEEENEEIVKLEEEIIADKDDIENEENPSKHFDTFLEIANKIVKNNKKEKKQKTFDTDAPKNKTMRKLITCNTSMENIKKSLNKLKIEKTDNAEIKFHTKIAPESNDLAEAELQRQIHRDDFKKMEILGQFNHGFIITRLKNDLFIIDQHATDERYNFEDLQKNTVLESQKLVNPLTLELSAANESLLIDNLDIFKKNGFLFKINDEALCTKRAQLTSLPLSKNYFFGRDDIDEMLVMLKDCNYNKTCRPSRIKAMFASRACRKSVMIGKPLSLSDMRKLIDHMSEIDEPWTCAHGRPTMRHLINLSTLRENYE